MTSGGLSWLGIARLGLVQMALGAIVVLTTSTLNRVMVVELALPAILPGALVGFHYAVQILRPRLGYGSDVGGRRTPWIVGGMVVLALGGIGAALATAWMTETTIGGTLAAVGAFFLIGLGVGASGTALLTMLATMTAPARRPAAATIVWFMMIGGMVVTATVAGNLLDPFSPTRLVVVTSAVSVSAVVLAILATFKVEREAEASASEAKAPRPDFKQALFEVWGETAARRFTVFVFVSMLAYSAQDLILEPFAGIVFGMTPGESTKLAGVQHGGVLMGMLLVAITGSVFKLGSMRTWVIGGCIASAMALAGLASSCFFGPGFPIRPMVFLLGLANGAFAV
ncbi:MAG: BCD family MFS transporter, partial [Pseudomonadota bacterium]